MRSRGLTTPPAVPAKCAAARLGTGKGRAGGPCARAHAEGPCPLAQRGLGLVPPDTSLPSARQSASQSPLAQPPAFSAGHAP